MYKLALAEAVCPWRCRVWTLVDQQWNDETARNNSLLSLSLWGGLQPACCPGHINTYTVTQLITYLKREWERGTSPDLHTAIHTLFRTITHLIGFAQIDCTAAFYLAVHTICMTHSLYAISAWHSSWPVSHADETENAGSITYSHWLHQVDSYGPPPCWEKSSSFERPLGSDRHLDVSTGASSEHPLHEGLPTKYKNIQHLVHTSRLYMLWLSLFCYGGLRAHCLESFVARALAAAHPNTF